MSKHRNPLTKERWEYLKKLGPTPDRMIHLSQEAKMISVPRNPANPELGYMHIPWRSKGITRRGPFPRNR